MKASPIICGLTALLVTAWNVHAQVHPDQAARIRKTAPAKARVTPKKPRTVLIFSTPPAFIEKDPHKGYTIPQGEFAMRTLGEKTGAFKPVASDDVAMFLPERLKQFDAIVLNNASGPWIRPTDADLPKFKDHVRTVEEAEQLLRGSLLDFVANGGGLIGYHYAIGANSHWPQFRELFGAKFVVHPWNEKVAMRVEEPTHPLAAAFREPKFPLADEIYEFGPPYSRDNVRVLVSLDPSEMDITTGKWRQRKDDDYAQAWMRAHGQGRVFYCGWGHRTEIWWNPLVLQFYLDAIQFACGDLEAPTAPRGTAANAPQPVVEVEEDVYTFEPANNGAGPMWCAGSTCLVRIGGEVFASGLETLKEAKPLNNCRWMLFERGRAGWEKVRVDEAGRTREPCPLAAFADGRLFLSANPTLASPSESGGGPARPEILSFSAKNPAVPAEKLLPTWSGKPRFTEHSYRSFATDAQSRELILLQNIDYTHAEWAFLDRDGRWSAQGQLKWPWGANYDKSQPIRVCYPTVALKDRAVYFCGVSDIVEPDAKWREFKKQLTGKDWDYDFRRLFFTWTPDITREKFHDWTEIASRDKTAGWLFPADLWVGPGGDVHLLWTERAIDERLREKFFPEAKQSHALNYAVVRDGKIVSRRTLAQGGEGSSGEIPSVARFQVTPENRLFVFYYVHGKDKAGKPLSENRLLELGPNGPVGKATRVPLKAPFTSFFTATARAGSPPSDTLELLGQRAGKAQTISYARIRLGL